MFHDPAIMDRILDYIQDHPGCTTAEIKTAVPDIESRTVDNYVRYMSSQYIRRQSSGKKYTPLWVIVPRYIKPRQAVSE